MATNTEPRVAGIYQEALAEQWDRLAPVIQRHYGLQAGESLEAVGVMHRVYHARVLTPALCVTGWLGLLFPEQGENVQTTLTNEARIDSKGQPFVEWRRALYFQSHGKEKLRRFNSTCTLLTRGREVLVLEAVALRQAVALRLSVGDDGALVYESAGFYTRMAGLLIPVPAPARLFIREWAHPSERDCFCMKFSTTVPVFGNVFGYEGEFRLSPARE